MPKFKIGDILMVNSTGGIQTLKVVDIDNVNSMYVTEDLGSRGTFYTDPWILLERFYTVCSSTQPVQPVQPTMIHNKFEVGAHLTLSNNPLFDIHVIQVDLYKQTYMIKYLATDNSNYVGFITTLDFSVVHQDCILHPGYIQSKVADRFKDINPLKDKQCSCEITKLMAKGCQCGAVKSYKLKWG